MEEFVNYLYKLPSKSKRENYIKERVLKAKKKVESDSRLWRESGYTLKGAKYQTIHGEPTILLILDSGYDTRYMYFFLEKNNKKGKLKSVTAKTRNDTLLLKRIEKMIQKA